MLLTSIVSIKHPANDLPLIMALNCCTPAEAEEAQGQALKEAGGCLGPLFRAKAQPSVLTGPQPDEAEGGAFAEAGGTQGVGRRGGI